MRRCTLLAAAGLALACALGPSLTAQAAPPSSWTAVEAALGRPGAPQPGDVMKFSFPRADLSVSARGVPLKPAFALGSWVAFKPTGAGSVMVMGDLVLLETDVTPVMTALQAGGIAQTALHNHVLGESPHIMYMHISAHGDPVRIARTVHDALAMTGTPLGAPNISPTTSSTAAPPTPIDLDTAAVAKALGYAGRVNGGVYQVAVPRVERVTEDGMEIPASMGLATAINFQPTGGGNAAITGDFVMIASEVDKVMRALRTHGIEVTALHSHMLAESPRLLFMHFWANDNAVTLASGLRAALQEMAVPPSSIPARR